MLDTIIRGGVVVDGTGAPGFAADVGVRHGRVVSVGRTTETAAQVIDADGLVVAPGFIDIHTHYDAQILWDRNLAPSPQHGVTTVLGGNCGISLAPSHEGDVRWLLGLIARVEEVPTSALEAVVSPRDTSFKDYLDGIDRGLGVNAAFMVGHSSIRRAVMGEAASGAEADAGQIEAMCSLLRQALNQGAGGFSTALIANHIDGEGRPAPPQFAAFDEMHRLAGVCRGHTGAVIQMTPDYVPATPEYCALMYDMARISGRPFTYTAVARAEHFEVVEQGLARGAVLTPQAQFQDGIGDRLQLTDSLTMRHWPSPWPEIVALPVAERLRALSDGQTRRVLRDAAMRAPMRKINSQVFADRWLDLEVNDVTEVSMKDLIGRKVIDIAAARGVDPFDAWIDISVADRCRAGFLSFEPGPRFDPGHSALVDPRTLWGLFDSGAHLTSMVGASNPTRILDLLVRSGNLVPLEHAVHRLTGQPAAWWGLVDRGRIAEGCWADIVTFEPDRIGCSRMRRMDDWPGGAAHLTCDGIGVHHTIVNGGLVVAEGEYTGALPGSILRPGDDIR
ncbi:MAG: amidohydrolase family protein [Actinomycetota bacterium]|nr:amidohydrolase family protein [Actinomycetota bacterium]